MKSLQRSLIEHAADEGQQAALDIAQRWQVTLEDIAEAGSEYERILAAQLLKSVNEVIVSLNTLNRWL